MPDYSIWMEGFQTSGETGTASKVGEFRADSFRAACLLWANSMDAAERTKYFDASRLTYWGCQLFDNEADARKEFG